MKIGTIEIGFLIVMAFFVFLTNSLTSCAKYETRIHNTNQDLHKECKQ